MRALGVIVAVAAAGCGGEALAPVAAPVAAAAAAPEPVRLPIGDITAADVPALMAAVYPGGVPENVHDLGIVVLGERVALLTGADNADACADCAGSLSLFYLVRMETGFLLNADYRDFHASGRGGKFNREIRIERFGELENRPSYAGFTDVNRETACAAKTLTVNIFTDAGPRVVLEAPFGIEKGADTVEASIIAPKPYQAEFAISYESAVDDFVAPYLFVNQTLRQSFPSPAWTRVGC